MLNKKLLGTSSGLPQDDNFENVTLLLNGDGTNGGQNNTFVDSSTNNFTITRNGNTTQGSFSPYGDLWSNYFDGSANASLRADSSTDTNLSGDFTLQAWVFPTANGQSSNSEIISRGAASTTNGWRLGLVAGGTKVFYAVNYAGTGSSVWAESTTSLVLNKWSHIAATRSGNTLTIYINGVSDSTNTSFTTAPTVSGTEYVYIGRGSYDTSNRQFTGYISNASIIKGTALTTFNTTSNLSTSTTNQSLLTCASNRFIDINTATTAKTLTVGSTTSVQRFSPFEPSAPYSTSVIGGSGYLDGSGDYLTLSNDAAFQFGSGDFTIDGWFYSTSSGDQVVISRWSSPDSNSAWEIIRYAGTTYFQVASGSSAITITTSSFPLNQWNHFAMSKGSTTMAAWLNGTRVGTATVSGSVNNGDQGLSIGVRSGGTSFPFAGYLANLRVVKGTDVYGVSNTTITVPTAPTTAITNTSLLTNFTNASIADIAMQNNLETVGNAQVSTSVKKFGTGSLSFDGTGDYLRTPANNFALPLAGNFTIEFWLYLNSTSTTQTIIGQWESPTFWEFYYLANTELRFYYDNTNFINLGALSTGTWYHVAAVRSGSTITAYLNGTSQGTATSSATIGSATKALGLGSEAPWTSFYFNGYLDDVRITNGVARYTSNFTVPASALPTY